MRVAVGGIDRGAGLAGVGRALDMAGPERERLAARAREHDRALARRGTSTRATGQVSAHDHGLTAGRSPASARRRARAGPAPAPPWRGSRSPARSARRREQSARTTASDDADPAQPRRPIACTNWAHEVGRARSRIDCARAGRGRGVGGRNAPPCCSASRGETGRTSVIAAGTAPRAPAPPDTRGSGWRSRAARPNHSRSSASVAVFGSVTPLPVVADRGEPGRGRLRAARHRHGGVGISPAGRRRHRRGVPPATGPGATLAAEHLVELPAGRQVERNVGAGEARAVGTARRLLDRDQAGESRHQMVLEREREDALVGLVRRDLPQRARDLGCRRSCAAPTAWTGRGLRRHWRAAA